MTNLSFEDEDEEEAEEQEPETGGVVLEVLTEPDPVPVPVPVLFLSFALFSAICSMFPFPLSLSPVEGVVVPALSSGLEPRDVSSLFEAEVEVDVAVFAFVASEELISDRRRHQSFDQKRGNERGTITMGGTNTQERSSTRERKREMRLFLSLSFHISLFPVDRVPESRHI